MNAAACTLSGITGRFEGAGESIYVRGFPGTRQVLEIASLQRHVAAGVVCYRFRVR
jgi:hypothetical protein